jgi:hypothetical protein
LNGGMGDGTEYAAAQFFLEAIHHRDHGDQGGYSQRDTQHRGQGDKGNEVIAPLGAQVTQANKGFQGSVHGAN